MWPPGSAQPLRGMEPHHIKQGSPQPPPPPRQAVGPSPKLRPRGGVEPFMAAHPDSDASGAPAEAIILRKKRRSCGDLQGHRPQRLPQGGRSGERRAAAALLRQPLHHHLLQGGGRPAPARGAGASEPSPGPRAARARALGQRARGRRPSDRAVHAPPGNRTARHRRSQPLDLPRFRGRVSDEVSYALATSWEKSTSPVERGSRKLGRARSLRIRAYTRGRGPDPAGAPVNASA